MAATQPASPAPDGRPPAEASSASGARSVFVDLARAAAVLMMIQGHTIDAVLASELRAGTLYQSWSFLRGLTSCTFLMLSGFVFTIATLRHWPAHLAPGPPVFRRLRRFGFFLVLGYALHFPVGSFDRLWQMSDERWRSFLVADVLHCIAVSLVALQALVMVTRTPRRYAMAAAALATLVVVSWPLVWRADWSFLPWSLAAYLTPRHGSLFPLVPWSGYVFFGAVMGALYVREGRTNLGAFTRRYLMGGGLALLGGAFVVRSVPLEPLGATGFWYDSPTQFMMRAGLVLLVLAAAAQISRSVVHKPPIAHALAQESLTIYAVHLCLVYGSIWNNGLYQRIGPQLGWPAAAGFAAALWAVMALWAVGWNGIKRVHPRVAGALRWGAAAFLVSRLW